ncbi:MAG: hypothetical protein HRO68_09885 [Nitrosopumilus sp.]|nr:hypothetical protein [Nitrosopumilus sp.]
MSRYYLTIYYNNMNTKQQVGIYVLFAIVTSTLGVVVITTNTIEEAEAAVPFDSMTTITTQIQENLVDSQIAAEVQQENIDQAENLLYGRPIILQTNNVPDTMEISKGYDDTMVMINDALNVCVRDGCTDPTVAVNAKNLLDTNYNMIEIKANIEMQTTGAD